MQRQSEIINAKEAVKMIPRGTRRMITTVKL